MKTVKELLILADQAEARGDIALSERYTDEAIELSKNTRPLTTVEITIESLVSEIWPS